MANEKYRRIGGFAVFEYQSGDPTVKIQLTMPQDIRVEASTRKSALETLARELREAAENAASEIEALARKARS